MPKVEYPRFALARPRIIVIVVIAAVLLSAVGAVAIIRRQIQAAQMSQSKAVMKQALALDAKNEYKLETYVLASYISSRPPKVYQYPILVQLGTIALNQRDYSEAIKWYQQANAASGRIQLGQAVGQAIAYTKVGNRSKAIYYYRQAISLSPNQQAQTTVSNYEATIRQLEASP